MIQIEKASSSDFTSIRTIAYQTWPVTYGSILSKPQLTYMLEAFYSDKALQDSVENHNHHFILAKEDGVTVGFASYQHLYKAVQVTKIHKIYILPEKQGSGIGRLLIDAVEKIAKNDGSSALLLNVNRFNQAQFFYQKIGFKIIGQEDIELEHGYLMEDFILQKNI